MFNNLANYLLGTTSNQATTTNGTDQETTNLRLTSVSDDEWVLVDRDSEGNSELSSNASDSGDDDFHLTEDADRVGALLSRSSSTSSLPRCAASMEESWFLTPPPCFISSGPPVHVETSPLENLLIEHPSMSVYQQPALRRYPSSIRLEVLDDENVVVDLVEDVDLLEEVEDDDDDIPVEEYRAVRALQPHARNRAEVIRQQERRQGVKTKQAQKVQIQKACQSLKRGHLERNNKAREVNCRNQRLRRGERSQGATRSHANNNRKC